MTTTTVTRWSKSCFVCTEKTTTTSRTGPPDYLDSFRRAFDLPAPVDADADNDHVVDDDETGTGSETTTRNVGQRDRPTINLCILCKYKITLIESKLVELARLQAELAEQRREIEVKLEQSNAREPPLPLDGQGGGGGKESSRSRRDQIVKELVSRRNLSLLKKKFRELPHAGTGSSTWLSSTSDGNIRVLKNVSIPRLPTWSSSTAAAATNSDQDDDDGNFGSGTDETETDPGYLLVQLKCEPNLDLDEDEDEDNGGNWQSNFIDDDGDDADQAGAGVKMSGSASASAHARTPNYLVPIRPDLEGYFEHASASDEDYTFNLIKCRVVGCTFRKRYLTRHGWHNFERHARTQHYYFQQHDDANEPNSTQGCSTLKISSRRVKASTKLAAQNGQRPSRAISSSSSKVSGLPAPRPPPPTTRQGQGQGQGQEPIQIRADLEDYFEHVTEAEDEDYVFNLLKCTATTGCPFKRAYVSRQGWHNFERHLRRKHNYVPHNVPRALSSSSSGKTTKSSPTQEPIAIREDLKEYFEHVARGRGDDDHDDEGDHEGDQEDNFNFNLLKCRVEGCPFKKIYSRRHGWHGFVGHATKIHNYSRQGIGHAMPSSTPRRSSKTPRPTPTTLADKPSSSRVKQTPDDDDDDDEDAEVDSGASAAAASAADSDTATASGCPKSTEPGLVLPDFADWVNSPDPGSEHEQGEGQGDDEDEVNDEGDMDWTPEPEVPKTDADADAVNVKTKAKTRVRAKNRDRPHVCHLCGVVFASSQIMNRHIRRTHLNLRPFPCTLCPKTFVDKLHLQHHLRTHTGEKPFQCEVCGRGFAQRISLKVHLQTHTGVKPHECEVCHQRFGDKRGLRKHSETTHGQPVHVHVQREHVVGAPTTTPTTTKSETAASATEPISASASAVDLFLSMNANVNVAADQHQFYGYGLKF